MPSTVIASFNYDEETSTLKIVFLSGLIYLYKDVPKNVFLQMTEAISKGTFLNRDIKGKYDFEKMNDD